MTDLSPPSRTARLVVGMLATMALLTGTFVVAVVAFIALYVGVPAWVVLAAVVAAVIGFAVAFQRVRRAATDPILPGGVGTG